MSSARKIFYLLLLFTVYMMVFGAIMYAVERTDDDKQRLEKHVVLQNLWKNIRRKYNMTREEFDNITRVIHQSQVIDGDPWTYVKGIRFAVITCTTIGYGNITPKTKGGMMLCVIGALFGIPITLLTLNAIGALVKDGGTKIIQTIEIRLLRRTSVQSIEVKRLGIITVMMTLMILSGAAILTYFTDWSFTEGVYFWFISFSTIGFGDYLPNKSITKNTAPPVIAIGNLIFTMIGLAILASVINCALEMPKESWTTCIRCSQLTRAPQVENTEMDLQRKEEKKNSALPDISL